MSRAKGLRREKMDSLSTKDVVEILMESAFYFDLTVRERRSLIKHILEILSCEPPSRRHL
jgi:hypothetical protein